MKFSSRKTQLLQRNFFFGLLAVGLFLALPALILAAPGDLDPTFGRGGKVVTDISGGDSGSDVVLQPDGKLIVAGRANSNFAVVRYNGNGTLDALFGNGGIVITDFGGSDNAIAVALQPDGKIVAAGYTGNATFTAGDFALARYNSNGSLDSAFGNNGVVTTDFFGLLDFVSAVIIQPDGKIVVAGLVDPDPTMVFNPIFGLARYNSDGSLDTTFGKGGKVLTDFDGPSAGAQALVIQADGRLVAAGFAWDVFYLDYIFGLARYNTNGTLDATFGDGGKVVTGFASLGAQANALILQTDGKLVAAGFAGEYLEQAYRFGLARYNSDGSLDTTFGNGGMVFTNFNGQFSLANALVLQADGKLIAAGQVVTNGISDDFGLARYNTNGTLDTTFGTGGKITTDFGDRESARAIVIQSDGKIVAVGSNFSDNSSASDFALARYLGDSVVVRRTPFDFDDDGRSDISVFRPSDGVWYLNQSTTGFSATQFGLSTDKLTPADYDGDGKTDIAVFRDGEWYLLRSQAGFLGVQFGMAGDIPQPADFDGDGKAELAVYRSGIWYTLNLANNQVNAVQFGISSDKPVVGDYDGDGRADYAVYRDGTWYLLRSTQGFTAIQFGLPTDKLVPADYDGDGKTDQAVYRDGTWYLLRSQSGFTAFQFGLASDIPAPADYDGDGKTDAAVYRDGVWHLRQSTAGTSSVQFGLANDRPVPSAYTP